MIAAQPYYVVHHPHSTVVRLPSGSTAERTWSLAMSDGGTYTVRVDPGTRTVKVTLYGKHNTARVYLDGVFVGGTRR